MTETQRRTLREALIAQGFTRGYSTQDFGDGIYSETWKHPSGGASLVLQWGPKAFDFETVGDPDRVWAC